MWFRDAYTPAPGTRFALAAVFTGMDLERIPQHRGLGYEFELLPTAVTLAERLGEEGYDRAGFTILTTSGNLKGMGQGFRVWERPWPPELSAEESNLISATRTTDAALRYLDQQPPGSPYFLFAHYECTHEPYLKHAPWDFGDSDVDLYDSALAYCDHEIGRLLDGESARPDAANTAIVLYSDHGELFGEHGFHQHGNSLFEPDVRVVFLVRPPASLRSQEAPSTVNVPVSIVDIAPTLLEMAGAPPVAAPGPPSVRDGRSLVPLLIGPPASRLAERPIFLFGDLIRHTIHYEARGVVQGGFKYIRYEPVDVEQLFDLREDPQESKNLAASHEALRARLAGLLR